MPTGKRKLKKIGETVEGQLMQLIEKGDIRAIKLYYDLAERKRKAEEQQMIAGGMGSAAGASAGGRGAAVPDMEEMAAIRRAVFGEEAVLAAMKEAFSRGMDNIGDAPLAEDDEEDDSDEDDG